MATMKYQVLDVIQAQLKYSHRTPPCLKCTRADYIIISRNAQVSNVYNHAIGLKVKRCSLTTQGLIRRKQVIMLIPVETFLAERVPTLPKTEKYQQKGVEL